MRWLHHIVQAPFQGGLAPSPGEGFVHCSLRDDVRESARLYYANIPAADLQVVRIDPRRLDVPLRFDPTPRGPMPHVYGPIPDDAIAGVVALEEVPDTVPDAVTGTRFALVGFARMTLLDLVGVLDPLMRIATTTEGGRIDASSSVCVVSATDEPWEASGARFVASRVRPDLREFDVVVVAGGPETRALQRDAAVAAWLDAFPHNRLIASVCTGALLLGAAGRLRGKRATTHHAEIGALAAFGATPVPPGEERIVDEGQLLTAGGVTSAIDLGLHLVERLYGEDARARIAARMEVAPRAPRAG